MEDRATLGSDPSAVRDLRETVRLHRFLFALNRFPETKAINPSGALPIYAISFFMYGVNSG